MCSGTTGFSSAETSESCTLMTDFCDWGTSMSMSKRRQPIILEWCYAVGVTYTVKNVINDGTKVQYKNLFMHGVKSHEHCWKNVLQSKKLWMILLYVLFFCAFFISYWNMLLPVMTTWCQFPRLGCFLLFFGTSADSAQQQLYKQLHHIW